MSGLFLCGFLGWGVSDAVGVFGCGVRIWPQRQTKFGRKSHFLSASEPRGADLESVVEHFFKFWRFCSTFGAVRGGFGVGCRTFFQFLEILFYFRGSARRIWVRE